MPFISAVQEPNIYNVPMIPSVTSDLALRNCLLSGNVTVKIGDYGLSHTKYKVCH